MDAPRRVTDGLGRDVNRRLVPPVRRGLGTLPLDHSTSQPTRSLTATYDAWNRLVSLADSATAQLVQVNRYDARTFRIERRSYQSGALAETRHFYFNPGWQVLEERLTGTPEAAPTDRQFVWGLRYIDELLCRDRRTSAASTANPLDERLYALHDANWNITAIVSASGAVMQRLSYSSYGEPRGWTATFEPSPSQPLSNNFAAAPTSSDPLGWEHSYCGYRWDDQPGLYAVRHRVLHPVLGTWIQRDPIGYRASMALYSYAATAPEHFTDPLGLQEWSMMFDSPPGRRPVEYLWTDSAYRRWLRSRPDRTRDNPNPRQRWDHGCYGVASCYIGRSVLSDANKQECYGTLAEAKAAAMPDRCCNAVPEVFAFLYREYLNEVKDIRGRGGKVTRINPATGIVEWGDDYRYARYDTQYYDGDNDLWISMDDAGGYVTEVRNDHFFRHTRAYPLSWPFYTQESPKGLFRKVVVFCVTCSGTDPEKN